MSEIGGHPNVADHSPDAPKRRRATSRLRAKKGLPSAAEFPGDGEAGAAKPVGTINAVPQPEIETAAKLLPTNALLPSSIDALVALQRQRVFCIKSQSRCDRSAEAFVARYLGYDASQPEAERAAVWKRARALRTKIEKGGQIQDVDQNAVAPEAGGESHDEFANHKPYALSACTPIILNSAAARETWDKHRAHVEKEMRRLARTLAVHAWSSTVAGFGDLGLGILVGETGDLANYATKERVWKRLGLAVISGERQQRKTGADAAAAHGYSPKRRAEVWAIADSMFKHQWRGEKEGAPAHAVGPYGEVYGRRKAHTATREGWTPKHRDNDARRVMTKFLVENLWRVWNGKAPITPQAAGEPRDA